MDWGFFFTVVFQAIIAAFVLGLVLLIVGTAISTYKKNKYRRR